MLGSRSLGSFTLAGGTVAPAPPSPGGLSIWIETDSFIETPVETDADVYVVETDSQLVVVETDADVVTVETDAEPYL